MADDYASVYDNYDPAARINERLAPYPPNGAVPCCTTITNPTRCITRVYPRGLQSGQPMAPVTPQDPTAQYKTGGYK
jgi:hypothetical protein